MFLLLVCLIGFAAAQDPFTCGQCDNSDDRELRTGCRIFCFFSTDNINMTKADLQKVFDNLKNADGVVESGPFIATWKRESQMCDGECEAGFEWFATRDPFSNPDVIDQSDIDAAWESLSPLGADTITKDDFLLPWAVLYLTISDPLCESGFYY